MPSLGFTLTVEGTLTDMSNSVLTVLHLTSCR